VGEWAVCVTQSVGADFLLAKITSARTSLRGMRYYRAGGSFLSTGTEETFAVVRMDIVCDLFQLVS
jgi:hypothetical protein